MPGMPARQRGPCRWCHARKATGAMPVVPSRHRRMPSRHRGHTGDDSRHRGAPSRHRGHALGAAYLNEFGHARLASVTACDRGAVGSARGGSTAVPSVGRTASCGAWLGTIKAAPPAMARPSRKIRIIFLASSNFVDSSHSVAPTWLCCHDGTPQAATAVCVPRGERLLHSAKPDNYLNECAAYAAGVDSAEARLAMFRLETLAQKDLKVCAHARPAQPHTTPRPARLDFSNT